MVRKTEKRLPTNYSAEDLGQAVSKGVSPGGEYHLVSYLTSPIAKGSFNDYVVFVTDGATEPDHYIWTFQCIYTNRVYIFKQKTEEGMFQFQIPTDAKRLEVKVELCDLLDTVLTTLVMEQSIIESFAVVDALMQPHDPTATNTSKLVDAGHPDTTREIFDNFRIYIEEAAFKEADRLMQNGGAEGIPPAFLAAIVYKEVIYRPYQFTWSRPYLAMELTRNYELEEAAEEINGVLGSSLITHIDNTFGVCQISLATLAMHLGLILLKELTSTGREAVRKEIADAYKTSVAGTDNETDLYNLLRFPKTNILMCTKILNSLKNRSKRWPNVKFKEFMADENVVKIIATEYNLGATDTPRDKVSTRPYGEDVLKYSKLPLIKLFFTHSINSYMLDSTVSLKKGDNDKIACVLMDNVSAQIVKNFVTELQTDLYNLAFLESKYITGHYGDETEIALIAFKIFARNTTRINRYTLEPITIPDVYTGQQTGIADATVAAEIRKWINNGWIGISPYGNYKLKKGDCDSGKIYDGQPRVDAIGNYVHELQKDLLRLGYWISTPVTSNGMVDSHGTSMDGNFGDSCRGSVYLFQREHGLNPTGEVDINTASKIKEMVLEAGIRKYRRPGHSVTYKYGGTDYNLTLHQLPPSDDYYMKNANFYLKDNFKYIDNAWGQMDMIEMLENTASEWIKSGYDSFLIVDLSHDDGSEIMFGSGDKHHPLGAKVDINSPKYCHMLSTTFDRFKSLELARLFIDKGAKRILFNCPYVSDLARNDAEPRKVYPYVDHHHHFHIDTYLIPNTETGTTVNHPNHFCKCRTVQTDTATGAKTEVYLDCIRYVNPTNEQNVLNSEWTEMKKSMTAQEIAAVTDTAAYVREHSTRYCFYEKRAGKRGAADNS
ncbi:MAG: hypothetical protein K0R34_1421 [Herbinix sp.]|jgi:peptidoglycan hydrolase-like protein with peptidoglycan-binding domain|nr:hypothetical protein [Herbinix sp.]